jgi:O-methyltransferase involved in polyketide biosynthesis
LRSRYAEDHLEAAIERGVRRYVVLGAGLDTFAYRNRHAERGLREFEVNHPATQAWKRELLGPADCAAWRDGLFASELRSANSARGIAGGGIPVRSAGVFLMARRYRFT